MAVFEADNAGVQNLLESIGAHPRAPRRIGPGVLSMEYDLVPREEPDAMTGISIRERMLADHAALERSLVQLGNAAEGASARELDAIWRAFESELSRHLALEEECMFPLVEDARKLEELREDHAAIRRDLDELGLSVQLHAIRKPAIDAFIERLRAHAATEDAMLYRLADERMDVDRRRTGCLLFPASDDALPERFQLALESVPVEAGGIWNLR